MNCCLPSQHRAPESPSLGADSYVVQGDWVWTFVLWGGPWFRPRPDWHHWSPQWEEPQANSLHGPGSSLFRWIHTEMLQFGLDMIIWFSCHVVLREVRSTDSKSWTTPSVLFLDSVSLFLAPAVQLVLTLYDDSILAPHPFLGNTLRRL